MYSRQTVAWPAPVWCVVDNKNASERKIRGMRKRVGEMMQMSRRKNKVCPRPEENCAAQFLLNKDYSLKVCDFIRHEA